MADNTIILQGKFTADGSVKIIPLRSDVDWMRVMNYSQMSATPATGIGYEYYWQRGMAADTGIEYKKTDTTNATKATVLGTGGFTLIDTSIASVSALNTTITAISTAALPIVSATDTTGISAGDVVRFIDVTSASQLGGIDFTVDTVIANTSFRLPYMTQLALAGTTGFFRKINVDNMYYPKARYITYISQAGSAVVKLSVTHGFTVGQQIKLVVPTVYNMTEANGLVGNIIAINTTTNTITLDIDSSAFTTFAPPVDADTPFTPAMVIPVGENNMYPDLNDDAVKNTSYIGMKLAAGVNSPAGAASDVIYWTAGKSFSVTNE